MSLTAILAILSKVPFIAGLVTKFKGKGRLLVEYILLAAFVAMSGLVLSLWITRAQVRHELAKTNAKLETTAQQLTTVRGQLDQVKQVNAEQQNTIDDLRNLRAMDSKAVTAMLKAFAAINQKDAANRKKLAELENNNVDVKNLFHQRVPPELACVLNPLQCPAPASGRGQNAGGVSHPASAATASVPGRR